MPTVDLAEWQQADLAGLRLDLHPVERAVLERLEQRSMVTVRELRDGVSVTSTSFVGSVRAGPLTIRIRPKLTGRPFSVLLGYAIGLPQIELLPEHEVSLVTPAFQDLLVVRLASEASHLLARGIHRAYLTRQGSLTSPRGRILFRELARAATMTPTLPCRFDERHDNVLPNRVLLAGLQQACHVAVDPRVRGRALRPAMVLADRVEPVPLIPATFRALRRSASRLTRAYEPAFALIRLLIAGSGIGPETGSDRTELPGFLFDMNRLFQEAVERFLREWLDDATVLPQYRLQDVFRYDPRFNPRRRQSPTPQPDYMLSREGRVVAIADAKYRDLWEHSLPPEMLYQLSVYALSQADCRTATILYATMTPDAREARIAITDPIRGGTRALVVLRPVCLPELAGVVQQPRTATHDRRRHGYASYLAYGTPWPRLPSAMRA